MRLRTRLALLLAAVLGLVFWPRGRLSRPNPPDASIKVSADDVELGNSHSDAKKRDARVGGPAMQQEPTISRALVPGDAPRTLSEDLVERITARLKQSRPNGDFPREFDWLWGFLRKGRPIRLAIVPFFLSETDYHFGNGSVASLDAKEPSGYLQSLYMLLLSLLVDPKTRSKLASDVVLLFAADVQQPTIDRLRRLFDRIMNDGGLPKLAIRTMKHFELGISPKGRDEKWTSRWNMAFAKLAAFNPQTFADSFDLILAMDSDILLHSEPLDSIFLHAIDVLEARLKSCLNLTLSPDPPDLVFERCLAFAYPFAAPRHQSWERTWKDAGRRKRPIFKASAFVTSPSAFHAERIFATAHRDWEQWKASRQEHGLLNYCFRELFENPPEHSLRIGMAHDYFWTRIHPDADFMVNVEGSEADAARTPAAVHGQIWWPESPYNDVWTAKRNEFNTSTFF